MNTSLLQNPIINYIKDTEILLFIICIALSFISAFIIDKFFISILKKLVKRTKTDIDDKLVDVVHPAIYKTILYIGFYIALGTVIFPEKVDFVLKGLIKSIIIVHWFLAIFRSFRVIISWISNKDNTNKIDKTNQRFIQPKTIPLFDNLGKIVIFLFSKINLFNI